MSKNKVQSLASNQTIKDAIQKIAWHGLVNRDSNAVRGTSKVIGYVAKVNTEGELAGTVDVQEYTQLALNESEDSKMGYHSGVFLSAIQNNSNGFLIVPKLYSDVVVSPDPETGEEYVIMYSHVDVIQLDSHETISIGVKEREDFNMSDIDSDDVDELKETGVYSNTLYEKDKIVQTVQGADVADHVSQTLDSSSVSVTVGDDKSSFVMTQDAVTQTHDSASVTLNTDGVTAQTGSSKVYVAKDTVYVGGDSSTEDAVLGNTLADILSELLNYITQITTATILGPQPPINMPAFIALKAKIEAFKSAHSGFLTKKVQIQK